MDLTAMLKILASQDGSDLYLATGAPPCAKFNGVLKPLSAETLKPAAVTEIANSIMDASQREEFDRELEMNLAISIPNVGRFRINIFKQRNEVSIVARNIKMEIPPSRTSNCRRYCSRPSWRSAVWCCSSVAPARANPPPWRR